MTRESAPATLVYGVYTIDLMATLLCLFAMGRMAREYPPLQGRGPALLAGMAGTAFIWRVAALVVYEMVSPLVPNLGCATWQLLLMQTMGGSAWMALFVWRLQVFVDVFIARAVSHRKRAGIVLGIILPSVLLWIIAAGTYGTAACPIHPAFFALSITLTACHVLLAGWYVYRLRRIRISYNESTELGRSLLVAGALLTLVIMLHISNAASSAWGAATILVCIALAPSLVFYVLVVPPLVRALQNDTAYLREWQATSRLYVGPVDALEVTLADQTARSVFRDWLSTVPPGGRIMALLDATDRFKCAAANNERHRQLGEIRTFVLVSPSVGGVGVPLEIAEALEHDPLGLGLDPARVDAVREWCLAELERVYYPKYCDAMTPVQLASMQSTMLDENLLLHQEDLA